MREKFISLGIPRSYIDGQAIPSFAFAGSSVNEIRQILRINILQQFLLVAAS
jgi:hypothetical protein